MTVALSVLQNIGLLSIGAVALILMNQHLDMPANGLRRHVLVGLILGSISVLVIGAPIEGPLGATFDTRAGPIVLAGYFAGPVGGLLAAAFGAAARYSVGGPAALAGVISILLLATAGMVYGAVAGRLGQTRQGLFGLLLLAAVSTAAGLPAFFIGLPLDAALEVLRR